MELLEGRNVVSRSPHRRVGYVNCRWLQKKHVQYESLLERDCAMWLLLCPHLLAITSQPFKVPIGDGAHYTPDFKLDFPGRRSVIVEVKPAEFLSQEEPRLLRAKAAIEAEAMDYVVLTEREIDDSDRAAQAGLIHRYGRGIGIEPSMKLLVGEVRQSTLCLSIEEWTYRLDTSRVHISTLVAMRELIHISGDLKGPVGTRNYIEGQRYAASQTRAWIGANHFWATL